MQKSIIYLGADHAGFEMKEQIREFLHARGFHTEDCGNTKFDALDDYPVFGKHVAEKVAQDGESLGIVFCGSGVGMCISVNKVHGIRGAGAYNAAHAESGRQDDDTNVLCIATRMLSLTCVKEIVERWINSRFKTEAKYARRVREIERIEVAESIRAVKKVFQQRAQIIPAILEKESGAVIQKLQILSGVAMRAQLDIMDGVFVEGGSFSLKDLARKDPPFFLEAHLMVEKPLEHLDMCKKTGIGKVIFHWEAAGTASKTKEIIDAIYERNMVSALALNPETPIEDVLSLASHVESVLVLGVHPGASGQEMLDGTLEKVRALRGKLPSRVAIGVDGGVTRKNIQALQSAGANMFCVGSALFEENNVQSAFQRFERILDA